MTYNQFESLEGRQLFAGGALDTTFAAGGSRSLTFRTATTAEAVTPSQLLTDSQGRSYVIATTASTFQIQRLTAAGQLDTSYGKRGSVVFTRQSGPSTSLIGTGVDKAQLDAADRLVLLLDNKLIRLTSTGAADTAFGSGGATALPDFLAVNDVTVDYGNRIYVTGVAPGNKKTSDYRARLERISSRGRKDTTFQISGLFDLPGGRPNNVFASGTLKTSKYGMFVRALADGSVVMAASGAYYAPSGYDSVGRVESVKFTVDGKFDFTYGGGKNGVGYAYSPADGDYVSYSLLPVGIRASGAVDVYGSIDGDVGADDSFNQQIDPDGFFGSFADDEVNYANSSNSVYAAYNRTVFSTLKDGRELATLIGSQVAVLTAGGGYDQTFNNGKPLQVTADRARVSGVAATGTNDGNILTAKPGVDRFTVVVNKFLTTGSSGQTVPVTPAATPEAGGGKLTKPATSLQFNVVYYAKGGGTIDGSQLDGTELRVLAANGEHRIPRLVSYRAGGDGGIIATYRTTDTDGSTWDKDDNGLYGVRLVGNTVKFSDGTFLPAAAKIGTLQVAIV